MSPPASPPPQVLARKIVAEGSKALDALEGKQAWKFGALRSFSREEHERLETVQKRIERYLGFAKHKRPLCVAVFGPPGSGKSFGVRQIFDRLNSARPGSLGWAELNLTQFVSPQELARAVVASVKEIESKGASVPFIFFDEFDASLAGASLGWLSWFLAPMQDGKFIADGKEVELKKAVYVFAGGTAAMMEEFGVRDPDAFRLAKGPDFVSRLHSHIDVRGPNDPSAREFRRGMALRLALDTANERTGKANGLDDALVDELVLAGRYRHGQRSVEAVITMMAEQAIPNATLRRDALPPDFLLDMQVDRGPLDPETIKGLIGLSGGGFPTGKQRADRDEMWANLAQRVWRLGATIAYGGNWDSNGLTQALINVALPQRLRHSGTIEPRLEIHARTAPPTSDPRATVVMVPEPLAPTKPVRQVAHLFRMRWQSGLRCRARILLSGKADGYSGRMPGIIEEAMIAIALGQPIYVLGGFGGGAALLGELLGLSDWAKPQVPLKPATALRLDAVAHLFRPAGFEELPLTTDGALSCIASCAIGGPQWTSNGLTVEENRRLFKLSGADASSREEAIALVERGLLRVFDR